MMISAIGEALTIDIQNEAGSPTELLRLVQNGPAATAGEAFGAAEALLVEDSSWRKVDRRALRVAATLSPHGFVRAQGALGLGIDRPDYRLRRRLLADTSPIAAANAAASLLNSEPRVVEVLLSGLSGAASDRIRVLAELYNRYVKNSYERRWAEEIIAFTRAPGASVADPRIAALESLFRGEPVSPRTEGEIVAAFLDTGCRVPTENVVIVATDHMDPVARVAALSYLQWFDYSNQEGGYTTHGHFVSKEILRFRHEYESRFVPLCSKLVRDPEVSVRAAAVRFLEHLIAVDTFEQVGSILCEVADEADLYSTQLAARAMRECLDQENYSRACLNKLYGLLSVENSVVQISALYSLQDLLEPTDDDRRRLARLFETTASGRVRCAVAETLRWWMNPSDWLVKVGDDLLGSVGTWLYPRALEIIKQGVRSSLHGDLQAVPPVSSRLARIVRGYLAM